MSKWPCTCGHIIADSTDYLPYKGYFRADQDQDEYYSVIDQLAEFIHAREIGEQERFFARHYGGKPPTKTDVKDVITSILARSRSRLERIMYECEQCGRLWIDYPQGQTMLAYHPEHDQRGILGTIKEEQ